MKRQVRTDQADAGGVRLDVLIRYLNRFLSVRSIPDISGVTNGLQHANAGRVDRVIAAVDACRATIQAAGEGGRALLVVHHGLAQLRRDNSSSNRERWRLLRRTDAALFTCHIPLDLHPVVGNNALLAGMLGVRHARPFGRYGRRRIGVAGALDLSLNALIKKLEGLLGHSSYAVRGGPTAARRVAVITGNGTRWIREAATAGIDTLVTGEAGHHDALLAEELGLNLVCGGHYATETVGVKALAAHIAKRFDLSWGFFDHPTGL